MCYLMICARIYCLLADAPFEMCAVDGFVRRALGRLFGG